MIRIVVVDDHPVVLVALARLFGDALGIEVVGTARDGAEAIDLDAALQPDVVVMDLVMPGMNGIEAARRITASRPSATVLIVASAEDSQSILAAFDAGVAGYLLKDAEPEELVRGVREAACGGAPLSAFAAAALVSERRRRELGVRLSAREIEILALVATGLLNKQIARTLAIDVKTVKSHLGRIFQRTGATGRKEAVLWAKRHGLLIDAEGACRVGPAPERPRDERPSPRPSRWS